MNREEFEFATLMANIFRGVLYYYSATLPWLSILTNVYSLGVFFLKKHNENTTMIFLFKWKYLIDVIFVINLLFMDESFTSNSPFFAYAITSRFASQAVCKLHPFIVKSVYCMSSWTHVVMTFDRFWSIYLGNKLKIKRDKMSLTVLIIIVVFGFVFLTNAVNLSNSTLLLNLPQTSLINGTLVTTLVDFEFCAIGSVTWESVCEIVYITMFTILPFLIMLVLNVMLVKHIVSSKKNIVRSNRAQTRENKFTQTIALMNGAFLLTNLPIFCSMLAKLIIRFSSLDLNFRLNAIRTLVESLSLILSFTFFLTQFWFDLAFNKIFRKEIFGSFLILSRLKPNQVTQSVDTTTRRVAVRQQIANQ